jgi:tetratricopeptide (TPR) repeat protein
MTTPVSIKIEVMYRRVPILLVSILVLTTAVTTIGTSIAQAGCDWVCIIFGRWGGVGPGHKPPEQQIAELQALIRQGKGTANTYLCLGYLYELKRNYPQSQASYSRALQLSINMQEQAIANYRLGEVYAATGRRDAALSSLREAQKLYETLGDTRGVSEVNQRQIVLQR